MDPCLDLEHLYLLDNLDTDTALDYLFEKVDAALWEGDKANHWPSVEELVKKLDPDRVSFDLQVGVLSITLVVKDQIDGREELFNAIRDRLVSERGVEKTTRLLQGLG